jgi:hypothetical protein
MIGLLSFPFFFPNHHYLIYQIIEDCKGASPALKAGACVARQTNYLSFVRCTLDMIIVQ